MGGGVGVSKSWHREKPHLQTRCRAYNPGAKLWIRGFWTQYSNTIITLFPSKQVPGSTSRTYDNTLTHSPALLWVYQYTALFTFHLTAIPSPCPITLSFPLFGETPLWILWCAVPLPYVNEPDFVSLRFVPGGLGLIETAIHHST